MRKFFNWYSISIIVILSIGAWVWLGGDSMMPEGEIFARLLFILVLFIVFIILSVIGIIKGSPKGNASNSNNDTQERTLDTFPTRPSIAIISFAIGLSITFALSYLINVGTFEPWRKYSPTPYISILEITTDQTVKVSNPSGETFIIGARDIDKCNDDECLKMEEETAVGNTDLDDQCFPKGLPPPRPPVKMASEEKVFRYCDTGTGNTVEHRYFVSENGDLWLWEKLINFSIRDAFHLSLFVATIFTLFVVALYSASGRFRKLILR